LCSPSEQVGALQGFVAIGHTFPTFPDCANPTVSYANGLNDQEDDGFCESVSDLAQNIIKGVKDTFCLIISEKEKPS